MTKLPVEFMGGPLDGDGSLECVAKGPMVGAVYPARIAYPSHGRYALYEMVSIDPPKMRFMGYEIKPEGPKG